MAFAVARPASAFPSPERTHCAPLGKAGLRPARLRRRRCRPSCARWRASAAGSLHDVRDSPVRPLDLTTTPDQTVAFDAHGAGNPVVRRFFTDDGERWLMWYRGECRDEDGTLTPRIGLATSPDGLAWVRHKGENLAHGEVFGVNREEWWWFDTDDIRIGDVQMINSSVVQADSGVGGDDDTTGVLFMFYHGTSRGTSSEPTQRIGIAVSKDGYYWTRLEGADPSGAVFDRLEGIASPQVVTCNTSKGSAATYRMYFLDSEHRMCTATSTNAVEWLEEQKGLVRIDSLDNDIAAFQITPYPRDRSSLGWLMLILDSTGCVVGRRSQDGVTWTAEGLENPIASSAQGAQIASIYGIFVRTNELRLVFSANNADGQQTLFYKDVVV